MGFWSFNKMEVSSSGKKSKGFIAGLTRKLRGRSSKSGLYVAETANAASNATPATTTSTTTATANNAGESSRAAQRSSSNNNNNNNSATTTTTPVTGTAAATTITGRRNSSRATAKQQQQQLLNNSTQQQQSQQSQQSQQQYQHHLHHPNSSSQIPILKLKNTLSSTVLDHPDIRLTRRSLEIFTFQPFTLLEKMARWSSDLIIGFPPEDPSSGSSSHGGSESGAPPAAATAGAQDNDNHHHRATTQDIHLTYNDCGLKADDALSPHQPPSYDEFMQRRQNAIHHARKTAV